ncbi:hypothetical protein ACS0TY_029863 [Phlomoides rotata]
MTMREVLEFSGHCQGSGFKHGNINLTFSLAFSMERLSCMFLIFCLNFVHVSYLLRKEKIAEVDPDQELDIFIKILGLDICADTLVGDEMLKGISGGPKKAAYNRELFLDALSTGHAVYISKSHLAFVSWG